MKIIKSLAKLALKRGGYEILRSRRTLIPDGRFGLGILELVVKQLAHQRGNQAIRLLQVGANDGIEEDPVRPLINQLNIEAIVCEPLPDVFEALQRNYLSFKNVTAMQCAVGPNAGSIDLYRIRPGLTARNDMLIASFDRRHVEHFCTVWNLPKEAIISQKVPCLTPAQILSACNFDNVDVAVVDAEGMDDQICESILDWLKPPQIIHFEYCNAPIDGVMRLIHRLDKLGYRMARSGLDVTAQLSTEHKTVDA